MTVQELIAKLKALPQDSIVLVDGYEGGFTEPTVQEITVKLNVHQEDYYGSHDVTDDADIKAVVLARSR